MRAILSIPLIVILAASVFTQGQPASTDMQPAGTGTGSNTPVVPPEKRRPVNVPKISTPPAIDGRPDEEIWKTAAVFKDFYQTNPGNNTPASKPTEAYLMYDEYNLYIAFKCWDEKDKIRATVAKRDGVFGEDNVRLWLDTFNDQKRAYVLGFNPFGVQQDGIFTEGSGADFSVDIVMESKGVIEDWGWSVEVKVPFKSLRYTAGKDKLWGFNAARNIDRLNDEFDQWLPDDRNVSGFLVKHGKISGLDGIKFEKTLEIVPSVTISETGVRKRSIPPGALGPNSFDPGRFVNQPIKQDIGVTLKYTLTPSVTLDAAYNPDFAEIEADAPVVTANQRFPIYFEEKRPFFLEGADIFRSPLQVFYSRNIVDPDVAVKLSGKVGKTSFGILGASDKAPGNYSDEERTDPNVRPRIDEFLDRRAKFAVLRLKRDVGKANYLGFFGTFRTFPEQKNTLMGVDGRFTWTPKMTTQFMVAGSHSRRCLFEPGFENLLTSNQTQVQTNRAVCGGSTFSRYRTGNGIAYYGNLDYTTETHGWFVEVGGKSKYYRADSGFTRRVNTNNAFFWNRFSTKADPKKTIIRKQWNQFTGVNYNFDGKLTDLNFGTNVNFSFQKNLFVNAETGLSYERIFEEEFGLKRAPTRPTGGAFSDGPTRSTWQNYATLNVNQIVSKKINYGLFLGFIRNQFDFFYQLPNGKLNPGPGFQSDANIYVEYKPIDPLRMSLSYNKSRLVRNDNKLRSFDSDLVTFRSTYQFTRFVFTRVRVDYNAMADNFSGQALFGWNPSPGKALYVGYEDNFNYNGTNPFTPNFIDNGFARNSRKFFIRMSYLFRKSF